MGTNTKPLKSKPVYVVEGKNFTADPLRSRGRTISVVLLVILFSLLIVFVLWAASRRVATFFHERGDARSRVGQYEESIPFYNWATLFYSLDSHATISRANAYEQIGEYEAAYQDYTRYIELEPESGANGYYSRGMLANKMGNNEGAIADLSVALERDRHLIEAYILRSRLVVATGDYQTAIDQLSSGIKANPDSVALLMQRGLLYSQYAASNAHSELSDRQLLQRSIADFDEASQMQPSNSEIFARRADARLLARDYQGAADDLALAIKQDPENPAYYEQLAGIFADRRDGKRDYQRAIEEYQHAIQLNPKRIHSYNGLGIVHMRLDAFEQAYNNFSQVIQLAEPDQAASGGAWLQEGLINRAWSLSSQQNKLDEALTDLDRAITLNPSSQLAVSAYIARARIYSKQLRYDEAESDLARAMSLDVANAEPYRVRGDIHLARQQYEQAVEAYSEAIKRQSSFGQIYLERGRAYRQQGDAKAALDDLAQAISLNPNLIEAFIQRGQILSEQLQYPEALNDFNAAQALDPQNGRVYSSRARVYIAQGESDLALQDLGKALILREGDVSSLLLRARLYDQLGREELAEYDYNRAVTLKPNDVSTLLARAQWYRNQGDNQAALADWDKALAIDPSLIDALLGSARAHISLGDTKAAIEDLDQASKINPDSIEIYALRASLYAGDAQATQATLDQARANIEAMRKLAPNDVANLMRIAGLYEKINDTDNALATYDTLLALDPSLIDAYLRRAALYDKRSETLAALDNYNAASQIDDSRIEIFLRAGSLRYKINEDWRAYANYKYAASLNPDEPRAHYGMGLALRRLGKTKDAIDAFERYLALKPDAAERADLLAWINKQ